MSSFNDLGLNASTNCPPFGEPLTAFDAEFFSPERFQKGSGAVSAPFGF